MGKIWRRILIGIVILAAIIGIVAKLLEPEEYTNTKPRQNTECTITQRVLDEAGKMTDKQKKDLEALIAEKEQLIGCDIVILTVNEPGLDSYDEIRDYAQAYYEDNKFGWNKANGDGIIMWMTGQRDTPGCVQLVLQKRDSMIQTQNRLWIVPTKS